MARGRDRVGRPGLLDCVAYAQTRVPLFAGKPRNDPPSIILAEHSNLFQSHWSNQWLAH